MVQKITFKDLDKGSQNFQEVPGNQLFPKCKVEQQDLGRRLTKKMKRKTCC